MDTADSPRPHHELARAGDPLPAPAPLPARLAPSSSGAPAAGGSTFSPRMILRGLKRHWWQALGLWVLGTIALGAAVYFRFEPTFESSALLRVEPTIATPYGETADRNLDQSLETQVRLITSRAVLSAVANKQDVMSGETLREAADAERALGEMITAKALPRSYLIEIRAESTSANEAFRVVEATVESFLDLDTESSEARNRKQIQKLEDHLNDLEETIKDLEDRWRTKMAEAELAGMGQLSYDPGGDDVPVEVEGDDGKLEAGLDRFAALRDKLFELQMEEVEAEAALEAIRDEAAEVDPQRWVDRRVADLFLNSEPVLALKQELRDVEARIADYRRRVRSDNDPAIRNLYRQQGDLIQRYEDLWDVLEPQIRAGLAGDERNPEQAVRRAELLADTVRSRIKIAEDQLETLKFDERTRSTEALDLRLIQIEYRHHRAMYDSVKRRLSDLKFASEGHNRIILMAEPRPQHAPISDKRTKYLAVTPLAVLGLVMGLMTLVEMRSGRVDGADTLSGRLPTHVFAVPPLPTNRGGQRGLDGPGGERFERFVQQLDHLRVALCGEATAHEGRGRCVLITSAVGGEGKTTLAAQLAVRCAEAGARTVLIDADLRRATLGRLFEVPECPGLSDVLRGDAKLDDALSAISQVGNNCFLVPAGSPSDEPNRILRGQAFGPMLERLRHSFDVVIVDTSPVLPVPDALILGRYADGAVLATRHDQSRYPAVERANHLLAGAGIPVLGVVVNGARSGGATAAASSYDYRSGRAPRDSQVG